MSQPQTNQSRNRPSMSFERAQGVDSTNVDIVGADQALPQAGATPSVAKDGLLGAGGIEIDTEKVVDPKVFDLEKFMAEPVEITMSDAQDENEAQVVEITVNGRYIAIPRGATVTIPRSHLAVLAQAKAMRVKQKKVTHSDGSMGYQETASLHLMYPFQVMHDPNPRRGAPWLRQLLQQQV